MIRYITSGELGITWVGRNEKVVVTSNDECCVLSSQQIGRLLEQMQEDGRWRLGKSSGVYRRIELVVLRFLRFLEIVLYRF